MKLPKLKESQLISLFHLPLLKKISAIMTEDYLKSREERADINDMEAMLNKVMDRKPVKGDEL